MTSRRPPSQRNPEYVNQRQSRQIQSFIPGALTGRLASAGPISKLPGPPDALFGFDGGNAAEASRASKVDLFTLAADGAQDLTLTYIPIDDSWNVTHNRHGFYEAEDFTISGKTLSLLDDASEPVLTGDKVRVQYDYLIEQPDVPTDDTSDPILNIPFSSDGWKWTDIDPGAGWQDPSFDDSGWTVGQMPIGNTPFAGGTPNSPTTATIFWVRRLIAPGTGINLSYKEANYYDSWIDGVHSYNHLGGTYLANTDGIADQSDNWLLAVNIYDFSIGATHDIGVDIEITGTPL